LLTAHCDTSVAIKWSVSTDADDVPIANDLPTAAAAVEAG
jgi:hypothetical protein